jgi:exodeoxyribonuclease VII large subunit
MSYASAPAPGPDSGRDIYSVSRLNGEVRAVLEGSFPLLWVEGEISNLSSPSSGHLYFSLKDPHAQVRCAMFRMRRIYLRFQPRDGQQVLVRARVGLYEGRGDLQLIVEHLEPAGEGALRQAVERLKQRLAAEGLFAAARKRLLPPYPGQLGVITSPSGAALHDVLSVLRRRWPGLPVVLYPVQVQGADAPAQICRALELANRRRECDLLLLVRGGGPLEDLMAFNDEAVVRGVAASRLPVVVGVGHEIDFTLADLAADARAATPSAAAELASPDRRTLWHRLRALGQRILAIQRRRQRDGWTQTAALAKQLARVHPQLRLRQRQQRLDDLELVLRGGMEGRLQRLQGRLDALGVRLWGQTPTYRLQRWRLRLEQGQRRLEAAVGVRIGGSRERLARALATLDAVSPLATLARGYAIVTTQSTGTLLRDARQVAPGQRVEARLGRGRLLCRVEECRD